VPIRPTVAKPLELMAAIDPYLIPVLKLAA
jgi:hypothetical protein